jgi:hypothetical protein
MSKPQKKTLYFLILIALSLLTACSLPSIGGLGGDTPAEQTAASNPLQNVADPQTAVVGEAQGQVDLREPGATDFVDAEIGDPLVINGQLRTGDDSRSRVDFVDGTIVRVGPRTTFTLTEITDAEGGIIKRLQMEFGKVWVILNGGALNVDTPAGVASVRGSYLAIRYNEETGEFWITCLEGTCSMQTDAGEVTLGAGQSASVMGADESPDGEMMDAEDFQDWLDNNPEAAVVAFDVPGTISNFVWFDSNANGVQDDGEFGVSGVGVSLYGSGGDLRGSTLTDPSGFYVFPGNVPGDYYLVFTPPAGYAFTVKDAGGDDSRDSDSDAAGYTEVFTTTSAAADTWDAGIIQQSSDVGSAGGSMDGVCYGPNAEDFPEGFNPMTGMPVSNPENLNLPAMLLSISNFPVSARPQSGLSFSPIIYEIYIGEGMTRFMTLIYGEFPQASPPTNGDYPPDPIKSDFENNILGNRVWVDSDLDGVQDPAEIGLDGVMVQLLDTSGTPLETTFTDLNGYYGFDVLDGDMHAIQVSLPAGYGFSPRDAAPDDLTDSDVDPATGISDPFGIAGNDLTRDAGVYLLPQPAGGSGGGETEAETLAIGDYVWFDANANGRQDDGEVGVPGVQVDLDKYEGNAGFQPYASFITDVNGNYLFANLPADGDYRLTFHPPQPLSFALANVGDDQGDSDPDAGGQIVIYNANLIAGLNLQLDAGLVYAGGNLGGTNSGDISAAGGIGPFRSGRLPYKYVLNLFPGGCLVYSGKDPSIDIPSCASVFNQSPGDNINSNFLGLGRLQDIAQGLNPPLNGVNYSGNMFCYGAPEGGFDVLEWIMYYNSNTQIKWVYDALSNTWRRFHDLADGTGAFHPSTDRLNGSQLGFANVVVLFAPHDVLNGDGTIIDIAIDQIGVLGKALLFRDGKAYDIYWTTANDEWEIDTGQRRPIKFVDAEGNPIALAPGSTWVHIVTLNTCVASGPNAGACVGGNNQSASAVGSLWPGTTPYVRFFAP